MYRHELPCFLLDNNNSAEISTGTSNILSCNEIHPQKNTASLAALRLIDILASSRLFDIPGSKKKFASREDGTADIQTSRSFDANLLRRASTLPSPLSH
jgi:hypothetical protein